MKYEIDTYEKYEKQSINCNNKTFILPECDNVSVVFIKETQDKISLKDNNRFICIELNHRTKLSKTEAYDFNSECIILS